MRIPRGLPALALSSASLLLGGSAEAVECQPENGLSTCVDADNLWPHPGPRRFLSLGSGLTTAPDQLSFELLMSYQSQPVGARVSSPDPDGTEIFLIDNQLNANMLFALGVTDRFELTLASPVTLLQDGAGVGALTGAEDQLSRSVVRDARFGYALGLLPRAREGTGDGISLTHRLELTVPIGDKTAFAGGATMAAVPTLALEYRFDELTLATEAGARLRGDVEFANAVWGTQLLAALGASYEVLDEGMLSIGAEAFALYGVSTQGPLAREPAQDGPALVPAEWIVTARTAPFLGQDLSFIAGGGGSIPFSSEAAFTSPRVRFNLGVAFTPMSLDADADGVPDRYDLCAAQPEDRDGFEDEDGCPELDNDGDLIPDDRDRCRDDPETVDGYQDEDGCPDRDDDGDGIDDDIDECRNDPEDRDGFEDGDGCPDPDNDGDGILDGVDRCPNGPEDVDGYKDQDGCPDPDNDADRIADEVDACPDVAEDRDGFQDEDGCPEPDNDEDGVRDRDDKCPNEAETLDGRDDDDGCPEPNARSTVRWDGDRVVVERPARFRPGSATPSPALAAQLELMLRLTRSRAPLAVVIVEAYPDGARDTSDAATDLAARRAEKVKDLFAQGGIAADLITAAAGDPTGREPGARDQIEVTVRRQSNRPNPNAPRANERPPETP